MAYDQHMNCDKLHDDAYRFHRLQVAIHLHVLHAELNINRKHKTYTIT